MLTGKKIGIVGAGNMGHALIGGLLRQKQTTRAQISVSDQLDRRRKAIAKEFGVFTTEKNREIVSRSDVIVLAVKPQVLERVVIDIAPKITPKKLIISIAAGVSIKSIEKRLPAKARVVRGMPNIAALVDAAATALTGGRHASSDDMKAAKAVFDAVGKTVIVEEEYLLDAVTGLSGSGPCYIFLIVDALADAGVKVGLSREDALLLASQTVFGAAKLLIETGEHPGRLKDMVTSPGGTAIAGIHTLEEGGLRTTLINAVERATQRSQELGKTFHRDD